MTTTSWTNKAGGDWNVAANWSNGVPAAGDTALITAKGKYTVLADATNTVGTLETVKSATLDDSGNLAVTTGTGSGALSGTIMVQGMVPRLDLGADGQTTLFDNTGVVDIAPGFGEGELVISGDVNLDDKGKVNLQSQMLASAEIVSDGTAALLGNENTISGSGTIGDGLLTLNNEAKGIINSNSDLGLTLKLDDNSTNEGLIETSSELVLSGGSVLQAGKGELKATSLAEIVLSNFTLLAGRVSIARSADLFSSSGSNILSPTSPIANAGLIQVTADLAVSSVKNTGSGVILVDDATFRSPFGVSGGKLEIEGTGAAVITGPVSTKVIFEAASTGVLELGSNAENFKGTVSGMAADPGASIILDNIAFADHPTLNYAKNVLTVTDPVSGVVDKIKIIGGGSFTDQQSGSGGTQIFDPPASSAGISHGARLLMQSIASFAAGSGIAASSAGRAASNDSSSDFLAANSSQHQG